MIKVKTKLLPIKNGDLMSSIGIMKNAAAKKIAADLESRVANIVCDNHPETPSEITVYALSGNSQSIDMKFTGWCCTEFKGRIKLSIES